MDANDCVVARVPKPTPELQFPARMANMAAIQAAPELLEALIHAAYQLDVAGIPLNEPFYDLINRARGPSAKPVVPIARSKPSDNDALPPA